MRDLTVLILPEVRELLQQDAPEGIRETLADFHPADIADLLANLEREEGLRLFNALSLPQRVAAFEMLDEKDQLAIVDRLGRDALARLVEEMSPDERADLMKAIPARTRDALWPLLAQVERNDIARLTAYAEGTAGARMTTEYTALPVNDTVGEALAQLRLVGANRETIYYLYLVDGENRLKGTVSLRELVLARPEQRVAEFMSADTITCRPTEDQETMARLIAKYDLLALPVVDEGRRLLGIVTHDDALDVMAQAATEDAHRMGAVAPLDASYLKLPFLTIARKRGGWLGLLFLAEIGTASTLGAFEATIHQSVLLVFFLPLIISQGGNSGSQSATLVTRALALGHVPRGGAMRLALRESLMGLALGTAVGVLGVALVSVYGHGAAVMAVIGLSIAAVVLLGSLTGAVLPMVLRHFGTDPAYASSPLVACLMDILGVTVYFGLATAILA